MTYLLDTAVWVHLLAPPHLVPASLLRRLRPEPVLDLASVSLLEVAILRRLGRLGWRGTLAQFFNRALAENVAVLELTAPVAVETNALSPDYPGDPFGRVVAATARILRLTPVTTDPLIRDQAGLHEVMFLPLQTPAPLRTRARAGRPRGLTRSPTPRGAGRPPPPRARRRC